MKKALFVFGLFALPAVASAQGLTNIDNLLKSIGKLISTATPIVVGLALLAFLWGLAVFVFSAGNEDAQTRGKSIMIWGVVALFVMTSVWGLVNFIDSALGLNDTGPNIPSVPGVGSN